MMKPDFQLFTYAKVFFDDDGFQNGIWRFVLKAADGGVPLEAFDHEDGWHIDRLNLLSVVRGLESLEQPSAVKLYSASRYITRAFESSMLMWKKNGWMWERFGEDVPIKNRDLWLRVDHAMLFHDVNCRFYQSAAGKLPRGLKVNSPPRKKMTFDASESLDPMQFLLDHPSGNLQPPHFGRRSTEDTAIAEAHDQSPSAGNRRRRSSELLLSS